MKLIAKEIPRFMQAPGRVMGTLLYGPDLGLIRQRMQQIIAAILTDPKDAFGRIELSAAQIEEDPARLYDELSAYSFTGQRRIVIVRDADDGISKALSPALAALTQTTYLLIVAGDLPGKSSLRALMEKHEHIAALPCYKDEGAGLDSLIRDTFSGYGLKANAEVVRYLTQSLGGDRMIILNEIEKISLYLGEEDTDISLEIVSTLVADNAERSQDDLNHAVASGSIETMCKVLDRLFLEGVNGVAMVLGLQRYFLRLQEIHSLMQSRGGSIEQTIDSLRPPVFWKNKALLGAHVKRWDSARIAKALERIMALEIEMKRYHEQQPPRLGQALIGLCRAVGR